MSNKLIYWEDKSASWDEFIVLPVPEWLLPAQQIVASWLEGNEAFTFYTSGSTGPPKAINLSRAQILASVNATIRYFGLTKSDVLFCPISFNHIGGAMMLFRALALDAPIILTKPSSILRLHPSSPPPSFAAIVPLQLGSLLALQLPLKYAILGGTSLTAQQLAVVGNLPYPAYQTFGMTETASHIAMRRLNPLQLTYGSLPHVNAWAGNDGRLHIKGEVTNNELLITNDIVHFINAKQFEWLGRADFVINSGGVKIHPEKVEASIAKLGLPILTDCNWICSSLIDDRLGECLVLVIEGQIMKGEEMKALLESTKDALPKYHAPKSIVFIQKLPLLNNGKINRLAVRRLIKQ